MIGQATASLFRGMMPPAEEFEAQEQAMRLLLENKEEAGAYIIHQLQNYHPRQSYAFSSAHYGVDTLLPVHYGAVLKEFGPEYIKMLEPSVLKSSNEDARAAGVNILSACYTPQELRDIASSLLVTVLKRDDSSKVQAAAINGLSRIRTLDQSELVVSYISSEHPEVRLAAVSYYWSNYVPDVLDRLDERLDAETDPDVARILSWTVCKYNHPSARTLLGHANAAIRYGALHYLAESSTERTEEDHAAVVARIGNETDVLCRYEMAEVLSRLGDARCLELFIGILKEPESSNSFNGGGGIKTGAATRLVNLTGLPFRVTDEDHKRQNEKRGGLYDGIAEKYDAWWRENKDRIVWSKGEEGLHWMFRVRME